MIYGLIDIGTNTIHAVIYSVDDIIKPCNELTLESEILTDTIDSKLSDEGIKKLIIALKKVIIFFAQNNTEKYLCFATSAMRGISNFGEVNKKIINEIGVEITLLTGYEEAECDFYAIRDAVGEACDGVGIDLGGGSCQIVTFEYGGVIETTSLPIGVKRMYKKFGSYSKDRKKLLEEKIIGELNNYKKTISKCLYIMGGTSKVILKLIRIITDNNGTEFDVKLLDKISDIDFCNTKYKEIVGKRVTTINYGIEIIKILSDYFEAEKICILKNGVREGYIIKNTKKSIIRKSVSEKGKVLKNG